MNKVLSVIGTVLIVVMAVAMLTSCNRYVVDRSMGGCGVWYPKNPNREARHTERRSYNRAPLGNFGW